MKQCETCLLRDFKDELLCCQANHLRFACRELLQTIPLIGKHIEDHKCTYYEMDITLTGYPAGHPVNCKCTIIPVDGDDS